MLLLLLLLLLPNPMKMPFSLPLLRLAGVAAKEHLVGFAVLG